MTTGRLILGAIMLVAVFALSIKLIEQFSDPGDDFRARSSVILLGQRIEESIDKKLDPPESSVIITMSYQYIMVGFSGRDDFTATTAQWFGLDKSELVLKRPLRCYWDESCLCLYKIDVEDKEFDASVVKCMSVEATRILGTEDTQSFELEGYDPKVTLTSRGSGQYDFFLSSEFIEGTFVDVIIRRSGNDVILDTKPVPPASVTGVAQSTGASPPVAVPVCKKVQTEAFGVKDCAKDTIRGLEKQCCDDPMPCLVSTTSTAYCVLMQGSTDTCIVKAASRFTDAERSSLFKSVSSCKQ